MAIALVIHKYTAVVLEFHSPFLLPCAHVFHVTNGKFQLYSVIIEYDSIIPFPKGLFCACYYAIRLYT